MAKVKSIEEKYKSLTEVEHILQRSGMWIGSINKEEKQSFIYDNESGKMILSNVTYIPAVLKLVDEIISNSVDEFRRPENMGLTTIEVTMDKKSGMITVKDNGGIPIVIHKQAGCYLPEFLFGNLRTSSNYDTVDNTGVTGTSNTSGVVGTNGVGSSLTNCWSTKYEINSADGKKQYHRTWSDNMKINDDLEITDVTKDVHFTETKFILDFKRLKETASSVINDDFVSIIEKRCIDAAAANPGLIIKFRCTDGRKVVNKSEWKFKHFEQYIELFSDYVDVSEALSYSDSIMSFWIFPDSGINIGFVNGAECSRGTHIRAIRNIINNYLCDYFKSKEKIELSSKGVDNKYSVFCNFKISNPTWDSQTKENLTNLIESFSSDPKYKFNITDTFLKKVVKSEIVSIIRDWYKQKAEVEDQKTLRKLNKQAKTKIRNNDKFIDANSKKRDERELWIFEGDSARAGFRNNRNPQTQAAYMLRGVIRNTTGEKPSVIMENKELSDIITILGLQWGEEFDPKKLNFGKIVIATDADYDGSKIAGLLLNFLNIWPGLFDAKMVCRSITPIIMATKGNDKRKYYTLDEFKNDEKNIKGYKVLYKKGLGSLSNPEYKEMLQEPVFHFFSKDELADNTFRLWFNKTIAKERKTALKDEV